MTRQRRRSLIKAKRTGMGIALVATLSFIAGMTDAIGLRMSGDFVSFMTGNTTRAAMSLQDGNWGHALKLLGAIATFVLGNAVGIVIAHRADNRIFAVLAAVGATLAVASVMPTTDVPLVQFYLVVLAMGMINAAVEHVEGLPIGLTYVTGALSRFGRGIGRWLIGERKMDWTIQIVPWLGMLSGALCGAVVGAYMDYASLWIVVAIVTLLAFITMLMPRSLRHRYNQRVTIRKMPGP
jgi:uncharacterized membrane protein YoaK (UPF0700 family)